MEQLEYSNLDKVHLKSFLQLFREIIVEDIPIYSESQKNYFLGELYSKENIIKDIENEYSYIRIVIHDDEVVGYIYADKTFGGVGYISWLGVSKKHRGNGISRKLIEEYKGFCRREKAHLIEVYTFSERVEFYKKLGFIHIGTRKNGYFNVDNEIMDLQINQRG